MFISSAVHRIMDSESCPELRSLIQAHVIITCYTVLAVLCILNRLVVLDLILKAVTPIFIYRLGNSVRPRKVNSISSR